MEMSQGNYLLVILNNKNDILLLFYKIMEQEGGMGPAWRVGTSERGRV
jgi:hypothetical protein